MSILKNPNKDSLIKKLLLVALFSCFAVFSSEYSHAAIEFHAVKLDNMQQAGFGSQVELALSFCMSTKSSQSQKLKVTFWYGDNQQRQNLTLLEKITLKLSKSRCHRYAQTLTLPRNVLYGIRYIHISAQERQKTHWLQAPLQVTGRPEVRVTNLRIEKNKQVEAGGQVVLSYRLKNTGKSRISSQFLVSFFFADSPNIIQNRLALRRITFPVLNAQSRYPRTGRGKLSILLPKYIAEGKYYISAIIHRPTRHLAPTHLQLEKLKAAQKRLATLRKKPVKPTRYIQSTPILPSPREK